MYITQKEMQIRVIVVCLFVGWGGGGWAMMTDTVLEDF